MAAVRLSVVAAAAASCAAMAPPPALPAPPPIVYACPGGETVRATYPDTRTAKVEYQGRAHTLKIAGSADGARYVGDGLQWWTKGMTHGTIAPLAPGQTYAEPGADCVAPDR
ncbi:MAG: MliC family protein [Caulobacteraceae bacterium]